MKLNEMEEATKPIIRFIIREVAGKDYIVIKCPHCENLIHMSKDGLLAGIRRHEHTIKKQEV